MARWAVRLQLLSWAGFGASLAQSNGAPPSISLLMDAEDGSRDTRVHASPPPVMRKPSRCLSIALEQMDVAGVGSGGATRASRCGREGWRGVARLKFKDPRVLANSAVGRRRFRRTHGSPHTHTHSQPNPLYKARSVDDASRGAAPACSSR